MRIFSNSDLVIQKVIGSRIAVNDKIKNDWDSNIHCQGHQNKISGLLDIQKGLLTVLSRYKGGGGCSGTNSFSYNSNFGDGGEFSSSNDSIFGDLPVGDLCWGIRSWIGKSSTEWRSDSSSRWDFSDFGGMNLTEFWFSSGSYELKNLVFDQITKKLWKVCSTCIKDLVILWKKSCSQEK